MEKVEIPRKTVYRLSIYQRCLQRLMDNAVETVSSSALAAVAGVKSTQLRKDLGFVGQFGTRGLGYKVDVLSEAITATLGGTSLQSVILVGVGNLGAALLRYGGFHREGFEIVAAFDMYPQDVKLKADSKVVLQGMDEMWGVIQSEGIKMAIMAVPAKAAQSVANELVDAGVQAILNFSPTVLQVSDQVVVNNVDLALELESLSYFVR
ncbi:MAG: redox-sensing transcriptional repressor Rex [Verrucomicrobia bacterium]|nr:redox-sensing transcriptional repressor Rex [Verrucomicrobiota bacterium]